VVEDSVDIAIRKLAEGGSGVHGNVYRDNTIQTEADALVVASELLNRYKKPSSATFNSYALNTEFNVGEIIEVNYPKYSIPAGSEFLVVTKTMTREKHRWVYTYTIEARDTSAYSGKPKSNAVDFFSKLARGTGLTGDDYQTISNINFIDHDITSADLLGKNTLHVKYDPTTILIDGDKSWLYSFVDIQGVEIIKPSVDNVTEFTLIVISDTQINASWTNP
jgi:hypothetical protein